MRRRSWSNRLWRRNAATRDCTRRTRFCHLRCESERPGNENLDKTPQKIDRVKDDVDLGGSTDLARYVLVRKTNNQPVLGGVVFVLVLNDQTFPGVVVGLTLTTPLEFHLVPLEVLFVLYDLNETLREERQSLETAMSRSFHPVESANGRDQPRKRRARHGTHHLEREKPTSTDATRGMRRAKATIPGEKSSTTSDEETRDERRQQGDNVT